MRVSVAQMNFWTSPLEALAQDLLRLDADIVCAQEVSENSEPYPGFNVAYELGKLYGYFVFYGQGHHFFDAGLGREVRHGNAIFSRFPFSSRKQQDEKFQGPLTFQRQIKEYAEWHDVNSWDTAPRVYVEASLSTPAAELSVATYHSAYTDWFSNDEIKKPEMERLTQMLKRHSSRFVFTADLNSLPDSYSVRQILGVLEQKDTYWGQGTWPRQPVKFDGRQADTYQFCVDYIFTTPDLKVVSTELIETSSDHKAKCMVIEL